jgi:hypothetical protein
VFDTGKNQTDSSIFLATFPSLAFLMQMDYDFVQHMPLEAFLATKKMIKHSYIVYADRNAWDSFIAKYHLKIVKTYFTICKKRQLHIKACSW